MMRLDGKLKDNKYKYTNTHINVICIKGSRTPGINRCESEQCEHKIKHTFTEIERETLRVVLHKL